MLIIFVMNGFLAKLLVRSCGFSISKGQGLKRPCLRTPVNSCQNKNRQFVLESAEGQKQLSRYQLSFSNDVYNPVAVMVDCIDNSIIWFGLVGLRVFELAVQLAKTL